MASKQKQRADVNGRLNKLQQHADAKKLLCDFYTTFEKSLALKGDQRNIFEIGFSGGSAGYALHTKEFKNSRDAFVNKACEILGPLFGDQKEIAQIIVHSAHQSIANELCTRSFEKEVFEELQQHLTQARKVLLPNYLVSLPGKARVLKMGPVRVLTSRQVMSEMKPLVAKINENKEQQIDIVEKNGEITIWVDSYPSSVPSHNFMWEINLRSSRRYAIEESKWMIGVSLSLIRLFSFEYGYSELGSRTPGRELSESIISLKTDGGVPNVLSIEGERIRFGGGSIATRYELSKKALQFMRKTSTTDKISLIFSAPENSVAEKLYDALGWLSRGRQSRQRAEKMLCFFTALETIFSTKSDKENVTERVARYCGVVLTSDLDGRIRNSNKIRNLYNVRSEIVHQGRRTATSGDVDGVEQFAEYTLAFILQIVDLKQNHGTFLSELKKASYGHKWPI